MHDFVVGQVRASPPHCKNWVVAIMRGSVTTYSLQPPKRYMISIRDYVCVYHDTP